MLLHVTVLISQNHIFSKRKTSQNLIFYRQCISVCVYVCVRV